MRFSKLQDWLDWFEQEHPKKIDRGLERISRVAKTLELLEPLSFVITVAGTNGKGSSVAMLESILSAAGITTGSYTSPHLLAYNERIRIDGSPVDDAHITRAFEQIDRARGSIELSYFEFSTLAALLVHRHHGVAVTILEVGLGGRLDAVNIIDADVALITNISLDHTQWLGDTLEQIAPEKAAIARKGRVAIVADSDAPAALFDALKHIGAEISIANLHYHWMTTSHDWSWQSNTKALTELPFPNLSGEHQITNAAAVLMVCQHLPGEYRLDHSCFTHGLTHIRLHGRQEMLTVSGVRVLFDVAHNEKSAQQLAKRIASEDVTGNVYCVLGIMQDKHVDTFISLLSHMINHWYVSAAQTERAMDVDVLSSIIGKQINKQSSNRSKSPFITTNGTLIDAWKQVMAVVSKQDLIVVTGSFYTVAEIRQMLIETGLISA